MIGIDVFGAFTRQHDRANRPAVLRLVHYGRMVFSKPAAFYPKEALGKRTPKAIHCAIDLDRRLMLHSPMDVRHA